MRVSLVLSVEVKSGRDYLFQSAKNELVGANRSGQILVLLVDVESERREFLIESARDKFVGGNRSGQIQLYKVNSGFGQKCAP
jgi:hypothetical protein